jgi:hypothetical protein
MICIDAGYQYCKDQGYKQNIARLEPIPNGNKGKIITEGNTAAALGAIYGGASVICWYPITPSSSLAEAMEYYLPRLRKPIKDKKAYAIVQAEDEIASVGMIVGAGWDRLSLLRGDSVRVFHHPARRSVDWFADEDPAIRHLAHVRRIPRRYSPCYSNSP